MKRLFDNIGRNVSNFLKQFGKEKIEETELWEQKIPKRRPSEIKPIDKKKDKVLKKIRRQQEKQRKKLDKIKVNNFDV